METVHSKSGTCALIGRNTHYGKATAQYQYGRYYYICEDGHRDIRKALKWLWRAVCQGNRDALAGLTEIATEGNTEARFLLGKMYLEGTGVDINDDKAYEYLESAARGKHRTARLYLALYLKKLVRGNGGNHRDEAEKIYRLLISLYRHGKSEDQCWLARLLTGNLYNYNRERFRMIAIELWEDAARKMYGPAWHALAAAAKAGDKVAEKRLEGLRKETGKVKKSK